MKKVICVFIMLVGLIGSIAAQGPIEESKKVTQDEVPVAVLKAYEADFGSLADVKGYWTLHYTQYEKDVAGRLVRKEILTPVAYVFKNKTTKAEARFNVKGELESTKGLVPPGRHGE